MNDEKLIYSGYIKGVYVNTPGHDINVLFGNDYEIYRLSIDYDQTRAGADTYSLTINKIEDLDISMKNIYLPQHHTEIKLDFAVLNKNSIGYFGIPGIFVINNDEVLSYVDKNSPFLMSANFYQIDKACKLNDEELPEYLDMLRYENLERIDIFIDDKLSGYENIAMEQLKQIQLDTYKKDLEIGNQDINNEAR